MKKSLLLCSLLLSSTVWAIDPPPLVEDDLSTPDVTIVDGDGETVYEYRRNGALVMVRVQPDVGPAYYFFDSDGDGELEHHADVPDNNTVAQWVLFRF